MRILLASDARPGADSAVRMAEVLAAETGAEIEVLHVIEPLPFYGPGTVGPLSFGGDSDSEGRSGAARERVAQSLARVSPAAAEWPLQIEMGPVPLQIVRRAERLGATLVLLGSGGHDRMDRWFGTETALRVAQISHIPVLTVPEGHEVRHPATVLIAVDFSDFSRAAIEQALQLCSAGAVIHLVHVISPPPLDHLYSPLWREELSGGLLEQLTEWGTALAGGSGRRIVPHVLEGSVQEQVIALGRHLDADLLVAGSYGHGFFGRVLVGSVSSALLRGAGRPFLVVPPTELAAELASESASAENAA